jgi:hypothetical protein
VFLSTTYLGTLYPTEEIVMIDLTKIIEGVEDLAYNILIWVLLIPKTLAKIVFHPAWVPGYVAVQLKDDVEKRFDDYISPVILIILSTLLPFAYAYITPLPNVTLSGPTQAEINKDVEFTAATDFISKAGQFTYTWSGTDTTAASWDSDQPTDYATYNWDKAGWKTITVTAQNGQNESYQDQFDVLVVDPNQPGGQGVTANSAPPKGGEQKSLQSVLEGSVGILAAIGFLSIPLLFALAIEAFRGNPLTNTSLMRSFYTQCYYLSPIALAAWSFMLGVNYFITPNQWWLTLLTMLVVLIMLWWLVRNEMLLIAAERRLHRGRAFWIVLGCLFLIASIGVVVALLTSSAEALRQFLDWFYIVFVAGLLLTGIWHRFFRKRSQPDVDKAD